MKKGKFLFFTMTLFIIIFIIFKFLYGFSIKSSIAGALPIPFWLTVIYLIIIWILSKRNKVKSK